MPLQLPPLPTGWRSLTNPEVDRLKKQEPNLWADPKKTCLTCSRTLQFTQRDAEGQPCVYDCHCLNQWKLHRWLANAGVGLRYQRISWLDATGVAAEVQEQVMTYVIHAEANVSSGTGMTLWSEGKGTGKTMLAALILKGLLAEGHDGYFTQFNEMLDFFSDGWRDAEERSWFQRKVRNAGVLVVDDMGREYKGRAEVAEAMFDSVIRARVAASRPTIITTNYTPEQMLSGYGSNILSLLSEVNIEVHLPGADFRPKARQKKVQDATDGITYPIVVG